MTASVQESTPAGPDSAELFRLGTQALRERRYPAAHHLLLAALERERTPEHLAHYALALAHHTGNVQAAVPLCKEAIRKDPENQEHFLKLATIHLIGGNKKEAIRVLHLGLRGGRHGGISSLLQILGHRQPPVLPFLSRGNPLNRYLGRRRMSRTRNC